MKKQIYAGPAEGFYAHRTFYLFMSLRGDMECVATERGADFLQVWHYLPKGVSIAYKNWKAFDGHLCAKMNLVGQEEGVQRVEDIIRTEIARMEVQERRLKLRLVT